MRMDKNRTCAFRIGQPDVLPTGLHPLPTHFPNPALLMFVNKPQIVVQGFNQITQIKSTYFVLPFQFKLQIFSLYIYYLQNAQLSVPDHVTQPLRALRQGVDHQRSSQGTFCQLHGRFSHPIPPGNHTEVFRGPKILQIPPPDPKWITHLQQLYLIRQVQQNPYHEKRVQFQARENAFGSLQQNRQSGCYWAVWIRHETINDHTSQKRHSLTYESGDFVYFTTLRQWDLPYDEGKVLYIQYGPREVQPNQRDTTQVKIKKVSIELFEEFRYVSLALMKPNSYEHIKKGDSQLIIPKDPKVCAQIRNNGLFVRCYHSGTDKNFDHYTYNLKIKLNRQRSSEVDVENMKQLQSKLHYDIMSDQQQLIEDRPALEDALDRHFEIIYEYLTKNKFETWYFHAYSKNNKALCDKFYQKFKTMMAKDELYPVHSAHQMIAITNTLKTYGLKEQFYPYITVSWQLQATLIHSNHYKSITGKVQQLLDGTKQEEMTQEERVIINNFIGLFRPLFPVIDQYQFKKKSVINVACYKKPGNDKIIFFNSYELVNNKDKFRDALCVILRA